MTIALTDAAAILGISVRRLRGWIDRGIVRPIPAPRRGVARELSLKQVVALARLLTLLDDLRQDGISFGRLR